MTNYLSWFRKGIAVFSLIGITHASIAAEQTITTDPANTDVKAGETGIVLNLGYSSTDNEQTSGLGVKIFFDSTQLDFVSLAATEDTEDFITGITETPESITLDSEDLDGDPKTDKFANIAVLDLRSKFPDEDTWPEDGVLPFATITFDLADTAQEDTVTGINYVLEGAAGFDTIAESATITIKGDEIPPEISAAETSITIEAEGPLTSENTAQLVDFRAGITASDNIQGDISDDIVASVAGETSEEYFFPVGTTVVDLDVKDSSGNSAETVQVTITVVDTTGPVISGAQDASFEATSSDGISSSADVVEQFGNTITALDLVDGQVEVVATVSGGELPAFFGLGSTTVEVTAQDASGNASTGSLVVTVVDTTAPIITSAEGIELEATGPEGYTGTTDEVIAAIQVSDLVDPAPAVALGDSVSTPFALGTTSVGVTVTDASGNVTQGSVPVTVVDTTGPTFSGANQLVLTVDSEVPVASSDTRVSDWIAGISASDLVDGEVEFTNSELPTEFPVGETIVTFSATDAAGNTTDKEVIVLVAVGPSVKVADPITIVSVDGEAVPASQPLIAAFISAATATDFSGNDLEVTNDAPDSFAVGEETVVTFSAVDADARQGQNSSTVTVVAASGENDTDGDGIDDLYEVENSLDPNDAEDATSDADGDGRSNLDEYLEGKDPNADDVDPVVTAPADVTANSTGLVTAVALGEAAASDVLDGEISATADNTGPFEPGTYTITWSATDAAGNVGLDTQTVVVNPQVTTRPKVRTAEGQTVVLDVVLNGLAPAYPVEVPVTLGGTATVNEDYTVDAEVVTIAEGKRGALTITVLTDELAGEGIETIEVTLVDPVANAILGAAKVATIAIIEEEVPPVLKISIAQGESNGRRVSTEGGEVSAVLSIIDPNGEHTIDWSGSSESLESTTGTDTEVFAFDPSALEAGSYDLVATVSDSGIADSAFTVGVRVKVEAEAVEPDSDGDGIPDSKDVSDEGNVIALNADAGAAAAQADEGVSIVVGDVASDTDNAGIAITEEQLAETAGGEDEDFNYPTGILDFEVQDLAEPGASFNLVVPLAAAIPEGATFRKFTEENGWNDFVVDENNAVASALGEDGACPDVGSELYLAGLTVGDTCLQLTLQDGGPNDADGEVNGSYKDPSGIAEEAPLQVVIIDERYESRKNVGGGCSVVEGSSDAGLLLLMLLGLAGLLRRRMGVV